MDGICSFQRVANVINNASPDVVAIQEVDSMTRRSGQKYVLGEIAERTQMHACFAPAIEFEGGKYGIGLLTKQVPLRLQTIPLPGREEARTLILAEFEDYIYDGFDTEDAVPEERIEEEITTLVIVGLNFERGSRWQFMYNGFKISMIVKDDALMQKIDEGERFGKGDAIKVKLRRVQRYNKEYRAIRE